jgi:hypothetical protein
MYASWFVLLTGYYSSDQIKKRTRWPGHVARVWEKRDACRVLVGKFKRKRPIGRPRHVWEGSIKTDLKEIGWEDVGWIDLAEDRDDRRILVKMVINLRIASIVGDFLTG